LERSFVEVWSLSFDGIGLVEEINRSGRVWFAFQLNFFRERARFPSWPDDVHADVLQYLAEQLGITSPEARDFDFGQALILSVAFGHPLGSFLGRSGQHRSYGLGRSGQ